MPPADERSPLLVQRTILGNGLTLVRQAPPATAATFSATYVGPGGWAFDPSGRSGLATFVASLMTSGAGRYDRVALARLLDGYGATLGARAAPESSEVTVWGPAEAADRLLEVLSDVVLRPRFDSNDIDRVRRQILERQLRELRQPDGRAQRELLRAVFPSGHPYRPTGLGEAAAVRKINRTDLRRFHAAHFVPRGGLLVVTTRQSLAELERDSRSRFQSFPRDDAPAGPSIPSATEKARVEEIPMAGHSQVEIRIGGRAVPRADPRYPAVSLADEVLGGRSILSRLFQRVREGAGLAYHASSDLEAMRWGGFWQVQAGTGPERVPAAVRLLEAEIDRIATEPIPEEELDRIRESAIGELPLALETTSGAHELALDIAYHGLPDDHLLTWPSTLRAQTPRAILEAVQTGLTPGNRVRVLAGPVGSAAPGRRVPA